MILRSVTKHVKEQNWFAVVLDLVIVVFGVYIGIQVSNWNERLVQEEETRVLIQRLYEDLGRERKVLANELGYSAIVKRYAITALQGFNDSDSVSDEQFVIAAYQASQISGAWSYRSAVTQLVSTGNINLIKDKGIEIPTIPKDKKGLFIGIKMKKDILGNNIIGSPDMGAIELK